MCLDYPFSCWTDHIDAIFSALSNRVFSLFISKALYISPSKQAAVTSL